MKNWHLEVAEIMAVYGSIVIASILIFAIVTGGILSIMTPILIASGILVLIGFSTPFIMYFLCIFEWIDS